MTIDKFEEMLKNKAYSDEYIANILSQLVSKHIKWKWDNRANANATNPYTYLESSLSGKLLQRYRPKVFKAVSQKVPA